MSPHCRLDGSDGVSTGSYGWSNRKTAGPIGRASCGASQVIQPAGNLVAPHAALPSPDPVQLGQPAGLALEYSMLYSRHALQIQDAWLSSPARHTPPTLPNHTRPKAMRIRGDARSGPGAELSGSRSFLEDLRRRRTPQNTFHEVRPARFPNGPPAQVRASEG